MINLGIGTPEYISNVAVEEEIDEYLTFTIESGIVGGICLLYTSDAADEGMAV